MHLTATG